MSKRRPPKKVHMTLRMPKEMIAVYRRIARTARLPVDTVMAVVMASYVVRVKMGKETARRGG